MVDNSWVWLGRYRAYQTRFPPLDVSQDLGPGLTSFAPFGAGSLSPALSRGLRRGLDSFAASRLPYAALPLPKWRQRAAMAAANITFITSAAMNQ